MRQAMAAVAIGLLGSGLAGCTLPNPFQALVPVPGAPPGDLTADRKKCDQDFPRQVGNYTGHAQCVNEAIEHDVIPLSRHADIIRLQEQLRSKYSMQIDRGAISPQDGERKMRQADELVTAAIRDRDTGRSEVAERRIERLHVLLAL
jgi:hypothetical protein